MSPHAHFNRSQTRIPALAAAMLLTLAVRARARPAHPGAGRPTRVPAATPTRAAQDVSTDIHATLARAGANGRAQHPRPINSVPAADDSRSVNWTTVGLGLAGSLLALSGIVVLIGRRSRRLRHLSLTP